MGKKERKKGEWVKGVSRKIRYNNQVSEQWEYDDGDHQEQEKMRNQSERGRVRCNLDDVSVTCAEAKLGISTLEGTVERERRRTRMSITQFYNLHIRHALQTPLLLLIRVRQLQQTGIASIRCSRPVFSVPASVLSGVGDHDYHGADDGQAGEANSDSVSYLD